ncbi:hypothetical protein [uncultured Flavobacterium sp.]|uniref:hypothetical protein n=1 Tax=uncultured Flavobacterium sp. TaxID=165435 RepID=UPI0027E1C425|nr:hypothetical protein [uncultured Flavobacterium sp.]
MTTVLFVHARSNYKKLPFFDCYDENRNALTYTGLEPVICHPPCRTFSRLKGWSTADVEEKKLAFWAVDLVRKNGGIVEHPYDSDLWKEINAPKPGTYDDFGGFTIVFDQKDFGYYTRKRTRLYIVGCKLRDLPAMPISFDCTVRKFENLTKKQRSETTIDLCSFLHEIINIIKSTGALKIAC